MGVEKKTTMKKTINTEKRIRVKFVAAMECKNLEREIKTKAYAAKSAPSEFLHLKHVNFMSMMKE